MVSVSEALRSATSELTEKGIETAALDASLLLSHATGKGRLEIFSAPEAELPESQHKTYQSYIERRKQHEPVAYIVGEKEFWGLPFKVRKGVLIPRPDTETLVATLCALVTDKKASAKVADLGVGSGAILLSILSEFENFHGVGVDMSDVALATAKENAENLSLEKRCTFLKGSWCDPLEGEFDVIVSNPPYISNAEMETLMEDVKSHEPHEALQAGEEGLDDYKEIIPAAREKLTEGGLLMLEIGYNQKKEVEELLSQNGFGNVKTFQDLAHHDRVVVGFKPSGSN